VRGREEEREKGGRGLDAADLRSGFELRGSSVWFGLRVEGVGCRV